MASIIAILMLLITSVFHFTTTAAALPTPTTTAAAVTDSLPPLTPANWTPAQLRLTDSLAFTVPLANFTAARTARDPAYFNWDSDNCTLSPDSFFGVDFGPACQRHDFGTRQYRAQGRMDRGAWELLAEQLERDMLAQCDAKRRRGGGLGRKACHAAARWYKFVVWNADKFGKGWGVAREKGGKKKGGEAVGAEDEMGG